jgi:hypothetical protein
MHTRCGTLFLACALAGITASHPAWADESIQTRNGQLYRGEILERVVGDHVTIRLSTGEIRRIEWADLAPAPAPTPAPAPPPVVAAPPPAPVRPPPAARVDFRADTEGTELQQLAAWGSSEQGTPTGLGIWSSQDDASCRTTVCRAPCSMMVDPYGRYRVAGPGLLPSASFSLSSPANTVDARMNSHARRNAGRVLSLFVGMPITLVGVVILGFGAAASSEFSQVPTGACPQCSNPASTILPIGGVFFGIGLASIVTGAVLWGTAGTRVVVNGVEGAAPRSTRIAFAMDGLHF